MKTYRKRVKLNTININSFDLYYEQKNKTNMNSSDFLKLLEDQDRWNIISLKRLFGSCNDIIIAHLRRNEL